MLAHGEWLSLAAGIGASGVCLVVVAGVGAAMSSWRDALDMTRPETVSGELERRAADKARDDAILAAWARNNPWRRGQLENNMSQARPTLRGAVAAFPEGSWLQVVKATEAEEERIARVRATIPSFCPDTTAERARAALEAAKVAVPEPDVYAWFDPEKGRERG